MSKSEKWHTILVEIDGKFVGHGSLMRTDQVWSRHLGEIILLLSPEVRGKGLGNVLAGEIFAKAGELNLAKSRRANGFGTKRRDSGF